MTLAMRIKRTGLSRIAAAVVLAAISAGVAAQGTPTLESLISAEEFRAAGLDKLSTEERTALARWLQARGIRPGMSDADSAAAVAGGDATSDALRASMREAERVRAELAAEIAAARAATEQARQERGAAVAATQEAQVQRQAAERAASEANQSEFESRLQEPFTGWSGKTLFQLENGQVWRQRLPGRYVHREGDLPRVKIARNLLGYYEMELVDYGRKIGVSRVR